MSAGSSSRRRLYRVMEIDDDGHPKVGRSSTRLGVRVGRTTGMNDIPLHRGDYVFPNQGGMSVDRDSWKHIHPTLIDEVFDTDRDCRVWYLLEGMLGPDLRHRPDRKNRTHGYIEPARRMPLTDYEALLAATRGQWALYHVATRNQ